MPAEAAPGAQPLVGVVTVLYNSEPYVDEFLASLQRQARDVPLRLYAIENGATGEALERLRALAAAAGIPGEFVRNAANAGVAKANNQGIALALRDGCTHVLIANNDIACGEGVLRRLLAEVTDWRRAATPRILVAGSDAVWYAGGALALWTARGGVHLPEATPPQMTTPVRETEYAPTCFLLCHAETFSRVGVMDEQYFVYYDDVDFSLRCHAAGVALRYVPQAVVDHKVGGSTGGSESLFTLYYANRNRIYFIRKHLRGPQWLVALAYAYATRLVKSLRAGPAARREIWRGLADGWRLPLPR